MLKRFVSVFIVFCLFSAKINAQNAQAMRNFEAQINQQMELVYDAVTDNRRYLASETATQLFVEALAEEKSIDWNWDLGKRVSVLTSPDKRLRVFTWRVVKDNGEYECFGLVQSYNEEEERYDVYELNDKSDEIINIEESILGPSTWLGAVYQKLIQTRFDGHTYYTLLGWTGVDALTQRKVIEPICFKSNSSRPVFGQPLFKRDRNRRRIVLEYSTTAMVNLRFEEQYVRTVERKRVKVKGSKKTTWTQENHDEKCEMIIFDEVTPQIPGMEGLFQYYVPSGVELSYVWTEGKWELKNNAQGRVKDERLNKEFAPVDKSQPSYKFERKKKTQTTTH